MSEKGRVRSFVRSCQRIDPRQAQHAPDCWARLQSVGLLFVLLPAVSRSLWAGLTRVYSGSTVSRGIAARHDSDGGRVSRSGYSRGWVSRFLTADTEDAVGEIRNTGRFGLGPREHFLMGGSVGWTPGPLDECRGGLR
jgi:hypothetical protein